MWDLISWTRDWAHVPCIGRQILNHWTTREVPPSFAYCSPRVKCAHCLFSKVQTHPFTYMVSTTAFLLQPKSWLIETVCMTWKAQVIYNLIPYWKTSSPLYSENNIYIDVLQWAPCRMEPRGQPDVGFGHWPSSSATWSLGPPAMFLAFSSIRLTPGSFVSTRKIPQLKSENNSGRKDLQHKLHVWMLLKFASSTHCYSWGCFISLQKNWET